MTPISATMKVKAGHHNTDKRGEMFATFNVEQYTRTKSKLINIQHELHFNQKKPAVQV